MVAVLLDGPALTGSCENLVIPTPCHEHSPGAIMVKQLNNLKVFICAKEKAMTDKDAEMVEVEEEEKKAGEKKKKDKGKEGKGGKKKDKKKDKKKEKKKK
jgi:hypothetical protein